MKTIIGQSLLVVYSALLFFQCTSERGLQPKIDKDQASIALMKELAPQLTGTWTMSRLDIKPNNGTSHAEIGIRKDTTLYNFATMTIAPALKQLNPTRGLYEGTL